MKIFLNPQILYYKLTKPYDWNPSPERLIYLK